MKNYPRNGAKAQSEVNESGFLGVLASWRETICLLGLAMFLTCTASMSVAGDATLRLQEPWANVFGGTTVVHHAVVSGEGNINGTVSWNLAADHRTLCSGDQTLDATGIAPLVLTIPDIKPGVVMEGLVSVAYRPEGATDASTSLTHRVWMFAPDPFGGRSEWLKSLDIHLFDPIGGTASVFEKAQIPYSPLKSVDAISQVGTGIVIVAEGLDLGKQRGLADALMHVAVSGRQILCLAPSGGSIAFPPPGKDGGLAVRLQFPVSLSFRQSDVITNLDKRLDTVLVQSALSVVAVRDSAQGQFSANGQWPWVEMGDEEGRIVFCGFGLIDQWDASPAPRYLFGAILDRLAGSISEKE
jgi:hypothetical protein